MAPNKVEIWKDIIGFEGLYQVSNLGKAVSKRYENPIEHQKTSIAITNWWKVRKNEKSGQKV